MLSKWPICTTYTYKGTSERKKSLQMAHMGVDSTNGPICATHTHKNYLQSNNALQMTHIRYIHIRGPIGEHFFSPKDPYSRRVAHMGPHAVPTCIRTILRARVLRKWPICSTNMYTNHLESILNLSHCLFMFSKEFLKPRVGRIY